MQNRLLPLKTVLEENYKIQVETLSLLGTEDVNLNYLVTTPTQKYVAKIMVRTPLDELERRRFEKSHVLYKHINQLDYNTPMVFKVIYPDLMIQDQKVHALYLMEYIIFPSYTEAKFSLTKSQRYHFIDLIAEFLKSIHQIQPKELPEELFEIPRNYNVYLFSTFEEDISVLQTRGILSDNQKAKLEEFGAKCKKILNFPKDPVLLHTDFWSDNILINPDDVSEFYVIDWEWSQFGDPLQDILDISEELLDNDKERQQFYQAYDISEFTNFNLKLWFYKIIARLRSMTVGFLYHNPPSDGYSSQFDLIFDFVHKFDSLFTNSLN